MTYIVIDTRTEQAVSRPYSTRAKAQAKADQLDNRFGAYRYAVQAREVP